MLFKELAEYFEKLESLTSRNQMTEVLAELFNKASASDLKHTCYLLQGRVAPLYKPVEFGMADKMVIRAISENLSLDIKKVNEIFKIEGDLGNAVEQIKNQKSKIKIKRVELNVFQIFGVLEKIARASGEGSQEEKINLLGILLREVDALSARYIVRIILDKLRLGFSDMTILDGLSWMMTGNKKHKDEIEASYNVRPDLGFIAARIKEKGIEGLRGITPQPGTPILMARANRLTSAEEIFDKIGKCAVEYKYDGLRLQVHFQRKALSVKEKTEIKMFSRNLEDVTAMFPDIKEAVLKQVVADEVIFEGEVVAYNPNTGAFVPFQETMQRKRKYDIEAKALEIPVKLFVFELLYANGENYLYKSYLERKAKLKNIITTGKTIHYAQEEITDKESAIDSMFDKSVELNFEGIIAKKLDGVYEAGMRGWNWIKYKKAMNKSLADTLDVLVMGYTKGEGKRTAFGVGQFLTGVYDNKQDKFVTVAKIGTGLTDEQFREFIKRVKTLSVKEKPVIYEIDKLLEPDVWMKPGLVVEIGCDEITRSAVHTAGRVMQKTKTGKAWTVATPGFALRFPRLERFRDDKRPEDTTTVAEITQMFRKQKS